MSVPADGGTPTRLTEPDTVETGYAHVWPQWVPGTRQVLFGIWAALGHGGFLLSVDEGEWVPVVSPFAGARYLASGHVVVRNEVADLQAAVFDPSNPAPTTAETTVLRDVYWYPGSDRAWFDVSSNGTLVYVSGNPSQSELVWVNRDGQVDPVGEDTGLYGGVALSGDGTHLAFGLGADLWVRDLERGTTTRVTFEAPLNVFLGAWTPEGDRLVFSANRSGNWEVYAVPVDGTGIPESVHEKEFAQHVDSTSPEGVVVIHENNPTTGIDLWTLVPGQEPEPFATSQFNEQQGRFSPSGRHIAYVSDESGRNEVYIRPYPGPGERVTVSNAGGIDPVWAPTGDELFYRESDDLFAVPVDTSPSLSLGESVRLMDVSAYRVSGDVNPALAVSPDGQRFLMIREAPGSRQQINVVLNWFTELRARVPVD